MFKGVLNAGTTMLAHMPMHSHFSTVSLVRKSSARR